MRVIDSHTRRTISAFPGDDPGPAEAFIRQQAAASGEQPKWEIVPDDAPEGLPTSGVRDEPGAGSNAALWTAVEEINRRIADLERAVADLGQGMRETAQAMRGRLQALEESSRAHAKSLDEIEDHLAAIEPESDEGLGDEPVENAETPQ